MKTKKLLGVLLVISVSVNVVFYLTSFVPQGSGCPEIRSYAGGVEISQADAQDFVNNFAANYPDANIKGGIISGDALKQVFCNTGANGLAYQFAMDPSGQYAQPDDIFIVIYGAEVSVDGNGQPVSWPRAGNKFFMNNNWCPPNCVSLTE